MASRPVGSERVVGRAIIINHIINQVSFGRPFGALWGLKMRPLLGHFKGPIMAPKRETFVNHRQPTTGNQSQAQTTSQCQPGTSNQIQATSHRQPVTAMAMATAMATAMAVTGCLLLVACIWLLVPG